MSLLSKQDAERIRQAVAAVERNTAGELVVAVIGRSDDYAFHRAVLCTLTVIAGGWLLYSSFPLLAPAYLFAGQGALWLALWIVTAWAPIVRLIVPSRYQQDCVSAKTKQAFIELGVTETRDRSGVLILLSEAEHRVEILADRGIHARVTAAGWASNATRRPRNGARSAGSASSRSMPKLMSAVCVIRALRSLLDRGR